MPAPSTYHGVCCLEVGFRLRQHVNGHRLGFIACNNSGIVLDQEHETAPGPDLSFWTRDRLPEVPSDGCVPVVPDLVVEVVSPTELFRSILRKLHSYLKHNVRLIWIVVPEDRSVTVYRPGQSQVLLTNSDGLTGEDVLPGFRCTVAELFP